MASWACEASSMPFPLTVVFRAVALSLTSSVPSRTAVSETIDVPEAIIFPPLVIVEDAALPESLTFIVPPSTVVE